MKTPNMYLNDQLSYGEVEKAVRKFEMVSLLAWTMYQMRF